MITRTAWFVLGVVVLAFGALGVVVLPGRMLLSWSLLGFSTGLCVWRFGVLVPASRQVLGLPGTRTGTGAVAVIGSVGACFVAMCFVVTGMVAVVGGAATTSVLLAVACVWVARRFWPGSRGRDHRSVPVVLIRPPGCAVRTLSTVELCAAWRRSYFELLRAVDGPVRERLVRQRQEYLDELERRDAAGFARWLANGARASSDPGRYLTAGS